jgi:Retrotransposon gag protein/Zinc knuckle
MAAPPSGTTTVVTGTRSLKLPTFSGGVEKDDLNPQDFVERIETYCQAMKRDQNDECTEMHLALRGNATIWWRTLKRRGINTNLWAEVRKEFLQTYAPTITGQTAHAIGQLEQKGTESVNDYFGRLDQIVEEMMTSLILTPTQASGGEVTRNHIQKYLFIGGLKESIRTDVLKATPSSLTEALREASKSELIHKKQNQTKIFAIEDETDDQNEMDLDDEEIAAINNRRMRMGKKPFNKRNFTRNPNPEDIKCYNCNKTGHIARNCKLPQKRRVRAIDEEETQEDEQYESPQPILAIQNGLDFW